MPLSRELFKIRIMNLERIEQDFRNKVCEKLRISTEGVDRFCVFTPFMFEDGDHLSTLHLWFARRPLVACRLAVYGALVPADQCRPKNGPPEKRESLGRANAANP